MVAYFLRRGQGGCAWCPGGGRGVPQPRPPPRPAHSQQVVRGFGRGRGCSCGRAGTAAGAVQPWGPRHSPETGAPRTPQAASGGHSLSPHPTQGPGLQGCSLVREIFQHTLLRLPTQDPNDAPGCPGAQPQKLGNSRPSPRPPGPRTVLVKPRGPRQASPGLSPSPMAWVIWVGGGQQRAFPQYCASLSRCKM